MDREEDRIMSSHQKRLPAPKHYPIDRKGVTYTPKIKGSRSSEDAIPATLLLREVLEYADTMKEAKAIVNDGNLLRNGEPVRDAREGIGVLDVVEIPEAEEAYRVIRKGDQLRFVPVTDAEKLLVKIVGKSAENGGYVYRLHSGENYRSEKEYGVGNSLILNGEKAKEIELEEGAEVLVIAGGHAGETAEVNKIHEMGMNPDTAVLQNGKEFETRLENLVAVEDVELGDIDG